MFRFQEFIHSLEEGKGAKLVRSLVLLLLLAGFALIYHLNFTRNFTAPEAMDAAQLARNISEGNGFKTQFIRPLAVDMLRQTGNVPDKELKTSFPDITHPPLYPLLLAAWMKVLPFEFGIDPEKQDFKRYQPEVLIQLLNQLLFFLVLLQVFRLGEKLFDNAVAWCSALVFLGAELYWQLSVSGLSTMLVLVLFLALAKALVWFEEAANVGLGVKGKSSSWFSMMALWVGILVGMGFMTSYAFGLVMLPVVVFLVRFGGRFRGRALLFSLLAFVLVSMPWLVRNLNLSGNLFGTSGLALYAQTAVFPGDTIERTLFHQPSESAAEGGREEDDFKPGVAKRVGFWEIAEKLSRNLRHLLLAELPKFSGGWFAVICLIGMVVPFRNPRLHRFRFFLLMTLAVFALGQALGRTHLSDAETIMVELADETHRLGGFAEVAPNLSDENLLAIVGPVSFLFGAGLFFSLLDQWKVTLPEMRLAGGGVLVLASALPLLLGFVLAKPYPVAYPPYYPPQIQFLKSVPAEHGLQELKPDDLLMSDLPWAVAWYGGQDSMWLPITVQPAFYTLNDEFRPVRALYFTEMTTDQRYVSRVFADNTSNWERFVLTMQVNRELPDGFPLLGVEDAFSPQQWFLFAAPETTP